MADPPDVRWCVHRKVSMSTFFVKSTLQPDEPKRSSSETFRQMSANKRTAWCLKRRQLCRDIVLEPWELLSTINSRPDNRVLSLPELLRGSRNIKGLRNTTMSLLFHDGQSLDERSPAQSDNRQSQNTTPRPFGEPTQIVLSSD